MENGKAYFAELGGTFTLVFFIVMSIAIFGGVFGPLNAAGLVGIALTHGVVLMVLVYALGPISGAHLNPAITIAQIAARKIEASKGAVYIAMQLIGGTVAALLQLFLIPATAKTTSYGLAMLGTATIGNSAMRGTAVELVLTFFLAVAVFAVVSGKVPQESSGLAIGGTLLMIILIGGPLTGGSVNPAREFGPAIANLIQGTNVLTNIEHWLVYWVGPIVGAILGGVVYKTMSD